MQQQTKQAVKLALLESLLSEFLLHDKIQLALFYLNTAMSCNIFSRFGEYKV